MHLQKRTLRSSVWWDPETGQHWREYHDTGRWTPLQAFVTPEAASTTTYRGSSEGTTITRRPKYLHHAMRALCLEPKDIYMYARLCSVDKTLKASTAWNYATLVVEEWPKAHALARRLVFPGLCVALESLADRSGTLTEVMQRLHDHAPSLAGDFEWRMLDDRHAHLRLARVCLDAADLLRAPDE